jgi:hypothetical protein
MFVVKVWQEWILLFVVAVLACVCFHAAHRWLTLTEFELQSKGLAWFMSSKREVIPAHGSDIETASTDLQTSPLLSLQ